MKPNKNGGAIFLIIIPLFMIIASVIYDNAIMTATAKKYRLDSEEIIKEVLSNSYEDKEKPNIIRRLYEDKDYETTQLDAKYEDGVLYVYNVHVYPAFFARLFGTTSYRTEVDLEAFVKNGEVTVRDRQRSYFG